MASNDITVSLKVDLSIDMRCHIALIGLEAHVAQLAEAARDTIRRDFARSRTRFGLRPIALSESRMLLLPGKFTCPECGGRLIVEVDEWSSRDGTPTAGGYRVMCEPDTDAEVTAWDRDEDHVDGHRYFMSDWETIRRRVGKWMVRNVRVVPC
mgnify:CR=1 FL=1